MQTKYNCSLPNTMNYSSISKTTVDEDVHTSVKAEGRNGNVATQQNALEQVEPVLRMLTPPIRKAQKIIKKRETLSFNITGSTGFSTD